MTKEQIHEALVSCPDDAKMRLAVACQTNGIPPQKLEETLSNVLTGLESCMEPAIEYYHYLGGK